MTTQNADVSDVTPKAEAPIPDPSLRSIVTQDGFAVGFAPGESIKEDGSFELSHSLVYKDGGIAVTQLELVLAHARTFHARQLYESGVAQGQRLAAGSTEEQSNHGAVMDSAPVKAAPEVKKPKTKKAEVKKAKR